MSGLELCPKCNTGHLYPVVTTSPSTETKGQFRDTGNIRDYECAICGYKQKGAKPEQSVEIKNKVSASVKKIKKTRAEPKTKAKTKAKRKRTKL